MMNGMENHTKEQAEGYVEDKKEDARLPFATRSLTSGTGMKFIRILQGCKILGGE